MLHSKGVEVDDEDVDPENIAHPTPATGRWELPRTCPRKGDPNITNSEGGMESEVMEHGQRNGPPLRVPHVHAGTIHQDVVLMETNKHLKEKLTLSEFYK
jgi:hypothetical protein